MKARYHGQCGHCYEKIKPGMEIGRLWPGQPFLHIKCLEKLRAKLDKDKYPKPKKGDPNDPHKPHPGSCCGG